MRSLHDRDPSGISEGSVGIREDPLGVRWDPLGICEGSAGIRSGSATIRWDPLGIRWYQVHVGDVTIVEFLQFIFGFQHVLRSLLSRFYDFHAISIEIWSNPEIRKIVRYIWLGWALWVVVGTGTKKGPNNQIRHNRVIRK